MHDFQLGIEDNLLRHTVFICFVSIVVSVLQRTFGPNISPQWHLQIHSMLLDSRDFWNFQFTYLMLSWLLLTWTRKINLKIVSGNTLKQHSPQWVHLWFSVELRGWVRAVPVSLPLFSTYRGKKLAFVLQMLIAVLNIWFRENSINEVWKQREEGHIFAVLYLLYSIPLTK